MGLVSLAVAAPVLAYIWFQIFSPASTTTWDDGQYAIPAWELWSGGSGALSQFPQSFSPSEVGDFKALYGSRFEEGFFIAPRHLWWSSVESLARGFGAWGLRIPPTLAVVGCVLGARRLAQVLGHCSSASFAGLLVLLSPIFYFGLQLWAHTAVAAAFTAALIGAVHLMNGERTPSALGLLATGSAVSSLLRGDSFVFALALSIGLGWIAFDRARRYRSFDGWLIGSALLALLASLAGFVGSSVLASVVVGPTAATPPALAGAKDSAMQVGAAVASVFSTPRSDAGGFALLMAGTAMTAAAVLALRAGRRWGGILFVPASTVLLLRLLMEPAEPANGLIAGWPVVLVIFARPWARFGDAERMLGIVLVLATGGVLVSQYAVASGGSWGGRYLAAAIPAACALVAGAVSSVAEGRGAQTGTIRQRIVVLAAFGSLLPSLYYDAEARDHSESHLAFLEATEEQGVFVTSFEDIAMRDWAAYPARQWLKVPADGGMKSVVTFLQQESILEFVVYSVDASDAAWLLRGSPPERYVDANGVFFRPLKVSIREGVDERRVSVVGLEG